MLRSGRHVALSNSKRKTFSMALFASLLLVVIILSSSVAAALSQNKSSKINHDHIAAHTLLKSSCSATFYPELCFSAISSLPPQAVSKIKSPKDVIELSLNLTITAVEHNYFTIEKLVNTRKGLTKREKTSLYDCLEMVDDTLDELHETEQELQGYPTFHNKSISEQADDLKILLSAAMTNQQTCVDGFSHDRADKKVFLFVFFFPFCHYALHSTTHHHRRVFSFSF
ncbi:hypothetical protein ACOSQ3_008778 [Xanthoceras sorbifolium]